MIPGSQRTTYNTPHVLFNGGRNSNSRVLLLGDLDQDQDQAEDQTEDKTLRLTSQSGPGYGRKLHPSLSMLLKGLERGVKHGVTSQS